jgi:hypothetical protein
MAPDYRLARRIAFAPLAQEADGKLSFALYSPRTAGRLDATLDLVEVLAAFGEGKSVEAVAEQLNAKEQVQTIEESATELARHGLLQRVAASRPKPPGEAPALFYLAPTGSLHQPLDRVFAEHPLLACTPPLSLVESLHDLLDSGAGAESLQMLRLSRRHQLDAIRLALTQFLNDFARRRQKQAWVYRSRTLAPHMWLVDEMFEGKARHVVVVRHPLAMIKTLLHFLNADRWGFPPEHPARRLLRQHASPVVAMAHYWREVYSAVRAFRQLAGERLQVVHSERLVEPHRELELGRLFLGLNVDWEPSSPAGEAPSDPGELDADHTRIAVTDDAAGASKEWEAVTLRQVVEALGDEPRHWGYTLEARS